MKNKLIMILALEITYKVAFTAAKLYSIYFRIFGLNCGFRNSSFLLKRKAMHHNIIVIQALERVYKVTFTADELYSIRLRLMEYNSSSVNVTLYTLSRA